MIGGVLASAAVYSYQHNPSNPQASTGTESEDQGIARPEKSPSHKADTQAESYGQRWDNSDFTDNEANKPFTASDVQYHLKSFYARFSADPPMSRAERDAFTARLSAAIEASPETRRAVADFYSQMPAKDAMERDILRNMLSLSPEGNAMLMDEAKRIWDSKDKSLYAHMYETYSNMPEQPSREIVANAISSLSDRNSDKRTEVAALNFIGMIEKDDSADAGKLRTNAVSQLNSVVAGDSDEDVRGLAAQKVYRLSSPESAADAAVGFLGHGAGTPLVMQTLESIHSGDVELTAPLRSTLAKVIARPTASIQERQRFDALTGVPHS